MESTFKRMNLGYVSTPEQDEARIALATKLLNNSVVKAKLKRLNCLLDILCQDLLQKR